MLLLWLSNIKLIAMPFIRRDLINNAYAESCTTPNFVYKVMSSFYRKM